MTQTINRSDDLSAILNQIGGLLRVLAGPAGIHFCFSEVGQMAESIDILATGRAIYETPKGAHLLMDGPCYIDHSACAKVPCEMMNHCEFDIEKGGVMLSFPSGRIILIAKHEGGLEGEACPVFFSAWEGCPYRSKERCRAELRREIPLERQG
ncbi:MAG: hypothetical protein R3F11_22130 [Verrucomicrobiales bacterium]